MRHVVKNESVGQLLSWSVLSLALAIGCTQSSTPAPDHAAAPASTKAATTSADGGRPATTEVAATTIAYDASAVDAAAAEPTSAANGAQTREVAKPVVSEYAPGVPQVLLSSGHSELCKVGVGDVLPAIDLPKLGGGNANLESLAGAKATVVLFWTADHWMSETALHDLARLAANDGVALVGIAVGENADALQKLLAKSGAEFSQLVDGNGQALSQVGTSGLPRIYVLDGQRRIAWFDIEFSESTHRELRQTLAALTGASAK